MYVWLCACVFVVRANACLCFFGGLKDGGIRHSRRNSRGERRHEGKNIQGTLLRNVKTSKEELSSLGKQEWGHGYIFGVEDGRESGPCVLRLVLDLCRGGGL